MISLLRVLRTIKRMWIPHDNVEQGAVRGAELAILARFIVKGVYFIKTIVLARLLFPEDFGLYGMAAAMIGISDLFQPGLNAALIHERNDVRKYLSSVWTFGILRNGVLAALIVAAAPAAGWFFEEESVTMLVRVLALALLIDGFVNVGAVLFQKELDFRKKLVFDSSYVVVETGVVIIAALITQSPWALVIGAVGNRLASVCSSFWLHPYRPKFAIAWEHIRRLFLYGKWLWLGAIISFVATKIDVFAIGKLLSPEDLGYFQLAFGLAMLPALEIARVLGTVIFPYAAIKQDDTGRIRALFSGTLGIIMAALVPTIFGFWIFGEAFVREIYGERWLPMAGIAAVLVLAGCLRALEHLTNSIALGIGRPDIQTKTLAVQTLVIAAAIFPLLREFGIIGAAYAHVAAFVVARGVGLFMLFGEIGALWKEMASAIVPPLLASGGMYAILLFAGLDSVGGASTLALGIVAGAAIYGAILFALDMLSGRHLLQSFAWLKKHS